MATTDGELRVGLKPWRVWVVRLALRGIIVLACLRLVSPDRVTDRWLPGLAKWLMRGASVKPRVSEKS